MATKRIPVLGHATLPDTSGSVFFEPSSVKDANDRYPRLVAIFNDTSTKLGLSGSFEVPQDYVGTAKIVVKWKTTATSGNAVWDFDYTAVAPGETADPSTDQEAATVTTAADATARDLVASEITLTSGNLAAGDLVLFTLSRDGAGSDTIAAALAVEAVLFQYADA